MLVELKQCFMEAYDDNQDGKIDIREVMKTCNLYTCVGPVINRCCTVLCLTARATFAHGGKLSAAVQIR